MRRLLYCCLLLPAGMAAQPVRHMPPCIYTTAGSYGFTSTKSGDGLSYLGNQASLGSNKQLAFAVHAEQKYSLAAFRNVIAGASIPVKNSGIGLLVAYYGMPDYNESQVGIAYGKSLGAIDLGVQFNYARFTVAGFGNTGAVTADLASLWRLSPELHLGIQVMNIEGGSSFEKNNLDMPFTSQLGIGYRLSDQVFVQAAIRKASGKATMFWASCQYSISNSFFARIAMAADTGTPFFAAGWCRKNFRIMLTGYFHPQLGYTPGLTLGFFEKQKGNP